MHTLRLSIDELPKFCALQPISLHEISASDLGGQPVDAGIGLKCIRSPSSKTPLLKIDNSIILCSATIDGSSKSDQHLAELLDIDNNFIKTERGRIMSFLILKMSTAAGLGVGAKDGWSEYIKFLPTDILLPTTWTEDERLLLTGTSLEMAVNAKLISLNSEFESFQASTESLSWAQKAWWKSEDLTLRDWVLVDAWYRSRVLQLPKLGMSMVPVLDFANHRSAKVANALYSFDDDGVVLIPRDQSNLAEGDEVTIDYSNNTKGAGEMTFSYGFIEDDRKYADKLALGLEFQKDDPLRHAKQLICKSAPIIELEYRFDSHEFTWNGDFIWLSIVNKEDGLSIRVLQEKSGSRSLQMFWNEFELSDITNLRGYLEESHLWPVFQLRAVALIQQRVEEQLEKMKRTDDPCDKIKKMGLVREQPWAVACRLRQLEKALMESALVSLEFETGKLLENDIVNDFLRQMQGLDVEDIDREPLDLS